MLSSNEENAIIKHILELDLTWERVTDKYIYRSETANFVLAVDFTLYDDYFLYIKDKNTGAVTKVKYSSTNQAAASLKEQTYLQSIGRDNLWVKDFLRDKKEKTLKPMVLVPTDDLIGGSRTE